MYFIWHFSTVSKVLISTGDTRNYNGKKTEVIDMEHSNVKCKDIGDFPMEVQDAVGANLASMKIIFGGRMTNALFTRTGDGNILQL